MNRLLLRALMIEAAEGRRVAYVGHNRDIRAAVREIRDNPWHYVPGEVVDYVKVFRAKGREKITHAPSPLPRVAFGSVHFFRTLDALRGHTLDVAVIDGRAIPARLPSGYSDAYMAAEEVIPI